MWKIYYLLLAVAVVITACGSSQYTPEPIEQVTPPPAARTYFSPELAAQFLSEVEAVWDADNGALWGIPLHAPLIIANHLTHQAVANMPDYGSIFTYQDGMYTGFLPENIFVGGTQTFGGRTWYVVSWSSYMLYSADDKLMRLRTMTHGGFHALQPGIMGSGGGAPTHLDTLDWRPYTFIEMNALLVALESTGDERLTAMHDALSIRAARQQDLARGQINSEVMHEISEGTAQYTEYMLNMEMPEVLADIRQWIDEGLGKSYAWLTFGYFGGAMYSMLLSEMNADWKTNVRFNTNLGDLLMDAVGITELSPLEAIDLSRYEYERIMAAEQAWFELRDSIAENARMIFAADSSVLNLPFTGELPFGELNQVSIGQGLVLHGTFEFVGEFGTLSITNGYFLYWHNRVCASDIEINGNHITGSYWELTLNDGFEVVQERNNFTVQRTE